jgi:hypothetical protein
VSVADITNADSNKTKKLVIPVINGLANYEVLVEDTDGIFDVTLNYTDLEYNIFGSNKYYMMQLVVNTTPPKITKKGALLIYLVISVLMVIIQEESFLPLNPNTKYSPCQAG